ncbi:MAG: DUF3786 domain-containing protein [Desulfamplus sp.]|nr:DUF3786 domain-containing protein [Desulfamplus sp.]MBF0412956.1 DUF3786 domain-containing protein [Desulfamplus sp.]
MEVFKLLNKSNCKECFKPTCLAFAGAVFKGQKRLEDCPYIPKDVLAQFKDVKQETPAIDQGAAEKMEEFKKLIENIDLLSKAEQIGGKFSEGRLTIKVMGKNVNVDQKGNIFTDIHANQWIVMPLLNYIVQGSNKPVSGNWVPFRELPSGRAWQGLFEKQCEGLIKKIADTYPGFFAQILELFNGKEVEKHYKSDISLVLHPLPKIPVLICYWLPDDGIESDLHLFFDASAEDHLHINSIYSLGAGLARMFEKLSLNHGF